MCDVARPWLDRIPPVTLSSDAVSVDVGCGRFPRNPLNAAHVVGVDLFPDPPFECSSSVSYQQLERGRPLPFDDNSVEVVTAFDVLEHLPRWDIIDGHATNTFIDFMQDSWRILKDGGWFVALTPCFPSESAFVDPTHVNPIAPGTVNYFAGPSFAQGLGYGYTGSYEIVVSDWAPVNCPLWGTQAQATSPERAWTGRSTLGKLRVRLTQWRQASTHVLWVLEKTQP